MTLALDLPPAPPRLESPRALARVRTTAWVHRSLYCPQCGRLRLEPTREGTPFRDFVCGGCREPFELKASRQPHGRRVAGGSLERYREALDRGTAPNLLLLTYDPDAARVRDLVAVNRLLISPLAVIGRPRPLARNSPEPYYLCDLDLSGVPEAAKVPYLRSAHERPKRFVLDSWNRFRFLREPGSADEPDWIRDLLALIARIPSREFTLDDLYGHEEALARLHPRNRHIRAKIRQKLQVLVRRRILRRAAPGVYESIV
ncbi:MAG: DpnI domain-containing protein [Thermoplasmata archaeon]|jgi:type II restriction enzyme